MSAPIRARSVRPTDLVALVSFDGQVFPNEAQSWSRVTRRVAGTNLVENAFEQWFSFATGRYSWISVKGRAIRAMLSARRRAGGLAWEVDCLILAEEDESLLAELVEQLTAAAARAGTRRVFLRLRDGSPIEAAVRRAGFASARRESLLASTRPAAPDVADPPVRPRSKEDLVGLFRLYNTAVPQPVRALEAGTMQEWLACRETRGFGRREEELVLEEAGRITGVIRLARGRSAGWLELTRVPGNRWLDAMLACGLRRIGGKPEVFLVVPDYATDVMAVAGASGFAPAGGFVTFVKRIAVPAAETELAPAMQAIAAL